MGTRGRQSMAALASVALQPKEASQRRLAPPSTLSAPEAAEWERTASCLPQEWLRPDQAPVLERYVKHICRAQTLDALIAAADPAFDLDRYQKLVTLAGAETSRILSLARSLRLTVQSRLHAVTAGSRSAAAPESRGIDALTMVRHGNN